MSHEVGPLLVRSRYNLGYFSAPGRVGPVEPQTRLRAEERTFGPIGPTRPGSEIHPFFSYGMNHKPKDRRV